MNHGVDEFIMACKLPQHMKNQVPTAVSIFENLDDEIKFKLKVQYYPAPDGQLQDFAYCGKSWFILDDISHKLAEWIQTQVEFGASKIFFSYTRIHPNVMKVNIVLFKKINFIFHIQVLKYYQSIGIVDLVPTIGGRELAANTCIYKYMYR